jgi:4-amino-4-deoxy-L-arabinose transferase-like glycosyltransferase
MKATGRTMLLLVFVLALAIWLPNLNTIPRWDWDEGYNLNYAWNLSEGRLLWFSLKYAFVPHPPLYLLVLAGLVKLLGNSILVLRLFTVAMNFAIILLLYLIGRRVGGEGLGVLSSLLFAIYPSAVYWGRLGFSNHMLSLLVVMSLYFLIRYRMDGGGWWVLACLTVGLSTVTEPQGLFVAAALLAYFAISGKNVLRASLLLFGFFILFLAVMPMVSPYFTGDILFQISRFKLMRPQVLLILPVAAAVWWKRRPIKAHMLRLFDSECETIFGGRAVFSLYYVPVALLAAHILLSYTLIKPPTEGKLFAGGDYYWLGIIGLLFMDTAYMNLVVLLYFLPSLVAVLAFNRSDHMLIPMYPLFALGLAFLLSVLYKHLRQKAGLVVAVVILSYPFAFAAYNDFSTYAVGGVLDSEPLLDEKLVVAYALSHSRPGDFIITTTNLARYFVNATEVTQAVAYEGYDIDYYRGYKPGRFVFNISFRNARYAVTPEGMPGWFNAYAPGPAEEMGNWTIVNRSGTYAVYLNPKVSA